MAKKEMGSEAHKHTEPLMCEECGDYLDDKGNCWRCIIAVSKVLEVELIKSLNEKQKALFLTYKEAKARVASLVIFT
jgi:hypothetical protein